ncbi:ABC transporter permease [Geminicoccaceae bacterium 1502E]|nr:ABC transporter permease [Geminicoccaceae bacterium 1502E]
MTDVSVSPPISGRWSIPPVLLVPFRTTTGWFGALTILFFLLLAAFGPLLAPEPGIPVNYSAEGEVARLLTPAEHAPLGTDYYGRDVASQLILGTRTAILVGVLSTIFTIFIGTNIGLIAAYYGGRIDNFLMRLTDLAFSIPFLPFAVILVALLNPSIWNIILTITVLSWRSTARIIRSQALSVKQQTFIRAARVAGASDARIIYRHIFPNVLPLALLYIAFGVSWAVLSEASLSFLGFGDPRIPSWGQMMYFAYVSASIRSAWWWTIPPGLCITLLVLAVFLVGREYERYVNPRS